MFPVKVYRTSLNRLWTGDIQTFADRGKPFEAASMSGAPGGFSMDGRLNREWSEVAAKHRGDISYTVYSYGTPIAWLTSKGWVIVDQSFSTTTAAHQSKVRSLYPQREDFWCPSTASPVPALRGEEKPSWIRGRVGTCPECSGTFSAPHGLLERHLPAQGA